MSLAHRIFDHHASGTQADIEQDAQAMMALCEISVRAALVRLGVHESQLGVHDVESLAAEVFLKILANDRVRSPKAVVWTMGRRAVCDALRAANRYSQFVSKVLPAQGAHEIHPGEIRGDEAGHLIDEVIEDLAPRDREVAAFCRATGVQLRDSRAIAQGLGISANAAAQSKARIRKGAIRFRPRFEELEGR